VKLEDPVAPFRGIVAEHRRAHAATNAERLRFGGQAPTPRPSSGPVAVLGASEWALDERRVERTLAYIGALGGLLADLGYDVFAVTSLPGLDARPAIVGWVGGGETTSEYEQLATIDAPGLSIGPAPRGARTWGSIQPEGQPTDIEFIGSALHAIRRLTSDQQAPDGAGEPSDASTVPSTVRPGTGVHGTGRAGYDDPRNPSKRARSGTERDGLNERSADS
jgi:hypothetical protein